MPHIVDAACFHPEVIPVEALTGEVVATLCLGCDEQLPEWYGQIPLHEEPIRMQQIRS